MLHVIVVQSHLKDNVQIVLTVWLTLIMPANATLVFIINIIWQSNTVFLKPIILAQMLTLLHQQIKPQYNSTM